MELRRQHQRPSALRQMIRFCCCIIICVTLATVASSASAAKGQTSKYEDNDEKTLNQLADETKDQDAASSNVESLYDVTSGLSMLPKTKSVKEQSDRYASDTSPAEKYEDYYWIDDDVDAKLLERFLKMIRDTQRPDNVDYDDQSPTLDATSQSQNASSDAESTTGNEAEMTSSAHERDRRSAGDLKAMTAEHMIPADGDAANVNKPLRLKRDLNDYFYRRRWIRNDDYQSPVTVDTVPVADGRLLDDESTVVETDPEDYEVIPPTEAQLRRYIELRRAVDELNDLNRQTYIPVVYRGMKGIFVPQTKINYGEGLYQPAGDWRLSSTIGIGDLKSAADKWSVLVRAEVKKALDEYDLVYRLAEALKKHAI